MRALDYAQHSSVRTVRYVRRVHRMTHQMRLYIADDTW